MLSLSSALPVSVDEVAVVQQGARAVDPPDSKVRDYVNIGVLDNLNANPLSCGIT